MVNEANTLGYCQWDIFVLSYKCTLGFPGGALVKNLPAIAGHIEDRVWSLGREDPLEEEMATHSSILAWKIPLDKGVLRSTIHRVTSSQTWLSTHRHTDTQENKWGAPFQITQVHALWPSNFTSLYSSNRYTCTFACADTIVNSIYIRTE